MECVRSFGSSWKHNPQACKIVIPEDNVWQVIITGSHAELVAPIPLLNLLLSNPSLEVNNPIRSCRVLPFIPDKWLVRCNHQRCFGRLCTPGYCVVCYSVEELHSDWLHCWCHPILYKNVNMLQKPLGSCCYVPTGTVVMEAWPMTAAGDESGPTICAICPPKMERAFLRDVDFPKHREIKNTCFTCT